MIVEVVYLLILVCMFNSFAEYVFSTYVYSCFVVTHI